MGRSPDDGYGCVHLDTVTMAVLVSGSQVSCGEAPGCQEKSQGVLSSGRCVSASLECSVSYGVFLKWEVGAGW